MHKNLKDYLIQVNYSEVNVSILSFPLRKWRFSILWTTQRDTASRGSQL